MKKTDGDGLMPRITPLREIDGDKGWRERERRRQANRWTLHHRQEFAKAIFLKMEKLVKRYNNQ